MLISRDMPTKILDKFGMSNSNHGITPTNLQFNINKTQSPSIGVKRAYMDRIPYASIVGS